MKFKSVTLTFLFCISIYGVQANTDHPKDSIELINKQREVEIMTERLNEIKEMDKSDLSHSERKALRKEVRDIKKNMNTMRTSGGIYISAGAVILIILLIILL